MTVWLIYPPHQYNTISGLVFTNLWLIVRLFGANINIFFSLRILNCKLQYVAQHQDTSFSDLWRPRRRERLQMVSIFWANTHPNIYPTITRPSLIVNCNFWQNFGNCQHFLSPDLAPKTAISPFSTSELLPLNTIDCLSYISKYRFSGLFPTFLKVAKVNLTLKWNPKNLHHSCEFSPFQSICLLKFP